MIEEPGNYPKLIVQELRGLNERMRLANPNGGEFDYLRNCIPTQANTLCKVNGIRAIPTFVGTSPILNITQTFDALRNIIIQTRDTVYVISEYDLFGVPQPVPALTPYSPPPPVPVPAPYDGDDELYPTAVIITPYTGGMLVNPYRIGQVLYQVNRDGTTATFASIGGTNNTFALLPGVYRIKGRVRVACTSATASILLQVKNVTSGGYILLDAGGGYHSPVANKNITVEFQFAITLAVPTTFSLEVGSTAGTCSVAVVTGFTFNAAVITINKTA